MFRRTSEAAALAVPVAVLCVSDETVLDPPFATVSRPFRTVLRGLGAGFWNIGGQTEKTAKEWERNEVKWARNGLKKVGPMTCLLYTSDAADE